MFPTFLEIFKEGRHFDLKRGFATFYGFLTFPDFMPIVPEILPIRSDLVPIISEFYLIVSRIAPDSIWWNPDSIRFNPDNIWPQPWPRRLRVKMYWTRPIPVVKVFSSVLSLRESAVEISLYFSSASKPSCPNFFDSSSGQLRRSPNKSLAKDFSTSLAKGAWKQT